MNQCTAAIQLGRDENGKIPPKAINIKCIYIDAQHSNPLCRVAPVKDAKKADEEILRYDEEKYKEMILDGAQSVLGYYVCYIDRTIYGDIKNTTPRKWSWLQELKQQREKDINTEMM